MNGHGGQIWAPDGTRRLRLDFSANLWPEPRVRLPQRLRPLLEPYPDADCGGLVRAAVRYYHVAEDQVLPVAGATQGLYLAMLALRPRRLALFEPTFSEYEKAARWATDGRVKILSVRARPENDFAHNLQDTPAAEVAVWANPNNPTGALLPRAALDPWLERNQRAGVTTIVDEAFLDFVRAPERYTLLRGLERRPRVLVLRSLTKRYGIAGIRIGFVFGAAATVARLRALRIPWSVDTLAQQVGMALLRRRPDSGLPGRVARERAYLERGLARLGFRTFPSAANFLLARMPEARSNRRLIRELERQGIGLRDAANISGLDESYVRCAVRPRRELRELLQAMEAAL